MEIPDRWNPRLWLRFAMLSTRRMGISRSYLTMLKTGERVMTTDLLGRFGVSTGCNLVRQYRALQSALRAAAGHVRQADRIDEIASHTLRRAA